MFTGIIQELGEVINTQKKGSNLEITISANKTLKKRKLGDSISINGACQTVIEITKNFFKVEAIPETLRLTNLGKLKKGDLVNLETSLKMGDSIDGHLVQGHVDCSAKIIKDINNENLAKKSEFILEIEKPKDLNKYIVYKGSITINGVSLTISKVSEKSFEVSLIPFTLKNTNLSNLKKGDYVNLEIDMIARYLSNMLIQKP